MAASPSPVEAYLRELEHALRARPVLQRRVVDEARAHLADAVAAELEAGVPRVQAERHAVEMFGPAAAIAAAYGRRRPPVATLAAAAAVIAALPVATALVATDRPATIAAAGPALGPVAAPAVEVPSVAGSGFAVLAVERRDGAEPEWRRPGAVTCGTGETPALDWSLRAAGDAAGTWRLRVRLASRGSVDVLLADGRRRPARPAGAAFAASGTGARPVALVATTGGARCVVRLPASGTAA